VTYETAQSAAVLGLLSLLPAGLPGGTKQNDAFARPLVRCGVGGGNGADPDRAINAGSPFTTTYSGVDVAPPEFNAGVLLQYAKDLQFGLFVIACLWTGLIWRFGRRAGARQVAAGRGR